MKQFYRIRFHLIAVLSILLGCFAPQALLALELKPMDGISAPVSLGGNVAVLRDPTGALTIQEIVSRESSRFEPIPSMLTEGYRKGAIWVRFSLSAPASSSQWLLQVERPLIEHVTLYVPDGAGNFVAAAPGRHHRNGDGDRAYPNLFSISVPTATTDYYLRFESSTSITTSLNIWQDEGYLEYRRSDDWIIGIVLGAIGAMLFANLLYAARLKDSQYLLYAALLLESGLMTLFHMGYASGVFQFLEPQWLYRSWGVFVCLYSIVMVLFLAQLFEFRRHWLLAWRIFQGAAMLNGVAMIFAIAGRYGDVGFFVSRLQQLCFLFVAGFAIYLLVVRRQFQYLLPAVAFAALISFLMVMQMQYTGANPLELDSSLSRLMAVGTLIHLVLLSAAVANRAHLAERSLSEEKDRVITMSRSAEQELTIKVRERTAELAESNASLSAEVDRRHLLETKLRNSLHSVNDALSQQRDFVALVSHEFRGPLAVIAATAENLSHFAVGAGADITARVAKIRLTVRRMSMLIENVLAGDRLDTGQSSSRIGMFDLNEVLSAAEAGLDDEAGQRVNFVRGGATVVLGDRDLLEIVVQNLIQNALKYSPATAQVAVRLSADEGAACIEVVDRGVGVPDDDHEQIFMKYYRASGQSVKGAGLGLYISKEIARKHGGDLKLVSSGAGGSTFRLSLSIAEPHHQC